MDLEESQITRADPMNKLGVMALIAATRVIQLVRARDGLTHQKLTDGFDKADLPILKMANRKMEGETDQQKNPHRQGTLAWAAWIIGRLGGWTGYCKPPGPKITHLGLICFDAMKEGWFLANGSKMCESRRPWTRARWLQSRSVAPTNIYDKVERFSLTGAAPTKVP